MYTAIMHTDRKNRSRLRTKNSRNPAACPPCFACFRTHPYRNRTASEAYRKPVHWAMRVPQATPAKPSAGRPAYPKARPMDRRMFVALTRRSQIIGLTVSCMPMNQPLKANSERVAGAAQMRM